jgi:hypothetical protein
MALNRCRRIEFSDNHAVASEPQHPRIVLGRIVVNAEVANDLRPIIYREQVQIRWSAKHASVPLTVVIVNRIQKPAFDLSKETLAEHLSDRTCDSVVFER